MLSTDATIIAVVAKQPGRDERDVRQAAEQLGAAAVAR